MHTKFKHLVGIINSRRNVIYKPWLGDVYAILVEEVVDITQGLYTPTKHGLYTNIIV